MQNPYNHRKGRPVQPITIVPLPGQVSFRVICHVTSIGGVIGNSGAVVSQLRRETCCRIHCEESVRGSANGVILIVGSGSIERRFSLGEGEECDVSCAQEAMVRVFERVWEVEAEREWGNACDGEDEVEACCGVLADTTQIGAVVGRGGKNIVRMRMESRAKIWILPPPPCGRKTDQLIKITGDTLAVKKALVAVSGCLQACPPLDREPMSIPTEQPSQGTSPDQHNEFFPHLSSLLPPMSANSVSGASNAQFSSMDTDKDSNLDSNGTLKEVLFRMLCSNGAAGAVIGKRGAIIRALQNLSGASIMFGPPVNESGKRVVTVSALENLESRHSPAQNAVVLVLARSVEADIEKGLVSGLSKGNAVTVRLLVASDRVSCLNDKGGKVLSEIVKVTGADVQIFDEGFSLDHSRDKVVQITGEYKSVQNAILQVTSRLRDNLLPPEVLNEIKLRNCSGKVREADSSQVHQPTSSSLDSDQEPNLAQRMQRLSDNAAGSVPVKMQPQQITGKYKSVQNAILQVTGKLRDYLLPSEGLNEIKLRNCSGKVREADSSQVHQPTSPSVDSDQEPNLAQRTQQLSDNAAGPVPVKMQPQQITGEYKSGQNAVLQVTSRLRDYLLPPEALNEIKLRNCSGKVREADSSQVHQPTSSSLDSDPEPNLAQRMQRLSDNAAGPLPVKMQPQQTAGNGCMVVTRDVERGSATFGRSLDLERSMNFLLPREVLNEVGGRSPHKGGSETTFPGLLQSLGVSLDSVQENALAREMGKVGSSDSGGCPLKSQHLENVRRGHVVANGNSRGGLEVDSGKKSAVVKTASVEILVPEDVFGSIFSKDGCNLARLKEISGAKVEVRDPFLGESEGLVFISGTPDQTLVAQCLLQAFIQTNQ